MSSSGLASTRRAVSLISPMTSAGGGGTTLDTRPKSAGSRPMWKSAPSGPATCSRKKVPTDWPVTRRMTSPTR